MSVPDIKHLGLQLEHFSVVHKILEAQMWTATNSICIAIIFMQRQLNQLLE